MRRVKEVIPILKNCLVNHDRFKRHILCLARKRIFKAARDERCIYTTFVLGTALLNFGTRTSNKGHGPLDVCRVKEIFSGRVPKNLGGPRPPQELVSVLLKRGPRAANQKYSRPQSPCAHGWRRNRMLWDQKWAFWAPNILYFSREDGVEESPKLHLE